MEDELNPAFTNFNNNAQQNLNQYSDGLQIISAYLDINNLMIDYILYLLAAAIFIFVLNRYFSGSMYNGFKPNLWGYTAVLTGGNTGIGKQTAIALTEQGCRVIIGARDTQKSQKLVKQINNKLGRTIVQHFPLDLGDLQSIRQFVKKITVQKVDFLINNAGVMIPPKRTLTKSGYQMQYGINHIGHFYLTHLLWAKLQKADHFRVINVSSLAHKNQAGFFKTVKPNFDDMNFQKTKYVPTLAYSRSKLYNNLFTHALAQIIPQNKGFAMSLHPGVVRTQLTRYGITGWMDIGFRMIAPLYSIFTKSPRQGAQTTIFTVFSPIDKLKNGGYYSDCRLATQNKQVNKENWDRLWQISEDELKIKFGQL